MPVKSVFWFWLLGAAEVAVIVANKYPTSAISSSILSTLMRTKDLCLTPLAAAGVSLRGLGTLLRLYCYRAMKGFFTFDIRQNHRLITTGPYSIVRHPGNAGLSLVYAGLFCWHGTERSWLGASEILDTTGGIILCGTFTAAMVSVLVGLLKRMPAEDAALKAFGQEWVEWARRVPYSVILWVY